MVEDDDFAAHSAQLPPVSNVFGYLHSRVGLRPVVKILTTRLGLSSEQVSVHRSSFDDTETMRFETDTCSLEARPTNRENIWHFNGAVAGTPDEIYATLLPLVQNLEFAGFSAEFEIYDRSFQFVGACPRPPAPG